MRELCCFDFFVVVVVVAIFGHETLQLHLLVVNLFLIEESSVHDSVS